MNTRSAIRAITTAAGPQPVVIAARDIGWAARALTDRPNHMHLTDPTGLASSVSIGIAIYARQTTVLVDDRDSLLANLAALVTAGTLVDLPLVHVVLDDSPQAAGGAAPSDHADLCELAAAVGYPSAHTVDRPERLAALIREAVVDCPSPIFVRCLIGRFATPVRSRPGAHRRASTTRTDLPDWFTNAA